VRLLRSLTVLAAALPLACLPAATGQAAPPAPATYLALGDSVAFGTGATDPATQGYVPLLAAELQGKDCGKGKAVGCRVELVNLAQNGATTVSLIDRQLDAALALIEARNATRTKVDDVRLITITIGGNDVVSPVATACAAGVTASCLQTISTQFAQLGSNYADILSQLRAAAGPDTTIAVQTYYNAIENPGCRLNFLTALGRIVLEGGGPVPAGYNDVIRQQAMAYGAVVVDTAPVVDPVTETQPDCLHPNDAGHAEIAGAFANAIGNPFKGGRR
jgi:lysophospholipase L1-like esterase